MHALISSPEYYSARTNTKKIQNKTNPIKAHCPHTQLIAQARHQDAIYAIHSWHQLKVPGG